uniref:Ig-like domain-containing protein n=1 Tax=Cyprinodon variegatus TaxID=28743 RepID=A0A3Q2CGF6_CYPVA
RKISCCYTIHIYKNFTNSPVFPGNYQLIFPFEPILAAPGDDVILPCRVDPYWNAMEKTVEWSRPDLKASDPQKRVEYVYVHRFRKMDRDMMMETYIQRTSLSEGLRHGDVSLRIHNVSLEDNGRFRCFIPSLSREDDQSTDFHRSNVHSLCSLAKVSLFCLVPVLSSGFLAAMKS